MSMQVKHELNTAFWQILKIQLFQNINRITVITYIFIFGVYLRGIFYYFFKIAFTHMNESSGNYTGEWMKGCGLTETFTGEKRENRQINTQHFFPAPLIARKQDCQLNLVWVYIGFTVAVFLFSSLLQAKFCTNLLSLQGTVTLTCFQSSCYLYST